MLRKLEEEYDELQFHDSYFHEINQFIAPHLIFDEEGKVVGISLPIQLSEADQNMLLSYLSKIEYNRNFIHDAYEGVQKTLTKLRSDIREELEK